MSKKGALPTHSLLLTGCLITCLGCAASEQPPWPATTAAQRLSLEVCQRDGIEEPLLCGTMHVPADRSAPGTDLTVFFLVVPALNGNPDGRAWAEHPGGPGSSTVRLAGQFTIGAPAGTAPARP